MSCLVYLENSATKISRIKVSDSSLCPRSCSELVYNLSRYEMFLFIVVLLTLDVLSLSLLIILFARTEEKLKLTNSRDSDLWLP